MPVNPAGIATVRSRFAAAAGLSLVETLTEVVYPVADAECPKDTLTLSQSWQVVGPTEDTNGVSATGSYGRDDDSNPKTGQTSNSYCVIVEEEIGRQHPTGNAKFLSNAMTQTAPRLADEVAKRMRPRL